MSAPPDSPSEPIVAWDTYWTTQRDGGIYGAIARFYRHQIIRPALNRFVRTTFVGKGPLLHVGCGTGQVDVDVRGSYDVVGVDISQAGLNLYRRSAGRAAKAVRGSASAMPFADRSVAGIYSLGLLEHFEEPDIQRILKEFHRVLAEGGKLLLLWPPRWGPTVMVLDTTHFIVNRVLRIPMKLHPDEVSLLRSRAHLEQLIGGTGFGIEQFYFGPRDAFTHVICVLSQINNGQAR